MRPGGIGAGPVPDGRSGPGCRGQTSRGVSPSADGEVRCRLRREVGAGSERLRGSGWVVGNDLAIATAIVLASVVERKAKRVQWTLRSARTMQRASHRPLTPILKGPGLDLIDGDVEARRYVSSMAKSGGGFYKKISLLGSTCVNGACWSRRGLGRIDGTLLRRAIRAARPVLICSSFILTSSANLACREPRTTKGFAGGRGRPRPRYQPPETS